MNEGVASAYTQKEKNAVVRSRCGPPGTPAGCGLRWKPNIPAAALCDVTGIRCLESWRRCVHVTCTVDNDHRYIVISM